MLKFRCHRSSFFFEGSSFKIMCQHISGNRRCRWTAYKHYGYGYNLLYNKYWYWNPPIYYRGFYHHTRYYHPLQTKPVRYNLYKGEIEMQLSLMCMTLTKFWNDIFQTMKSIKHDKIWLWTSRLKKFCYQFNLIFRKFYVLQKSVQEDEKKCFNSSHVNIPAEMWKINSSLILENFLFDNDYCDLLHQLAVTNNSWNYKALIVTLFQMNVLTWDFCVVWTGQNPLSISRIW